LIRATLLLAFWSACILITGPWLVLYAVIFRDIRPLYKVATGLSILGERLAGLKIVRKGLENLRPGQCYIFMSNHASNLDPPLLVTSIPGRCSVLVKKELFRTPILGTGMRLADLVPVDRADREAAIESVKAATRVMAKGLHMVIYPEGTRSADGRLLPFKKGPFHLAMDSGVPVIPVTLLGTYESWPKTRFAMHPGTATVIFHPPIDPKGFSDREALMQAVRNAIASALPDDRK
jgi:1-acyl-sn-glycerol-3-phosphate acyltransferase